MPRRNTPGSINEGGELGYSLVHAYGAVFDNPDLIAACVVGDGEAETGPLATSWHVNKFLNPARDGAVLPILHLNGYKIAGPTVLARIADEELPTLFEGYGYDAYFVDGHEPALMHQQMAATLEPCSTTSPRSRSGARSAGDLDAPALADDRPALAEGLDRAEESSTARRSRTRGARIRCRSTGLRSNPEHLADARGMDAQLPAGGAVRRGGRPMPDIAGAGARRRAAHGRQPARQWRQADARSATCRTSATTRSPSPAPAAPTRRRRACSAASCAT